MSPAAHWDAHLPVLAALAIAAVAVVGYLHLIGA